MIVNPQFLQAICITFSEHKEFYVFFFFFFLFSTLQFLWIISSFLAFFFSTVRYMLLLLNHFSRVRFCATPWMGAHQAPTSLGFSRQEHWSGLPFPSPMQESEKWKWSRSVVSDPQWPPWTAAFQALPSMGFSRQEYWSGVPLPSLVRYICLPILIYLSILRWYSLISSCLKMRKPHCKFFLWICFAFTFHCFHSCLPNLYSYIMSAF